jgi:diguanylate cyclase (GGDEF)-like protein
MLPHRRITMRNSVGPLATIAIGFAVFVLYRHVTTAPVAAPLFLWAIVLSAYYGGPASGLVSAAIAIMFGAVNLSGPNRLFDFPPDNLVRFVVLAVVGVAIALTVGLLQRREARALRTERAARAAAEAASRESLTLRAALDEVDHGLVLLDADLRAVFINRAFRDLWKLPDDAAQRRPYFLDLLHHARDTGAYAVPPHELDAYVAQRMALVRAGDERPIDLRLADGQVTRFRGKVLPDGGRMLSYGNVTDLVNHAEEQEALATTDALTRAHNRRSFLALADSEWERFCRYDRCFSLLLADIDHFKAVNDRFGHDAGDAVLVRFADILRALKRESDVLARLGGEEFAVLMPETDRHQAVHFAERLCRAVADSEAKQPRITVSIGIAKAEIGVAGIADLMKRADLALYDAKRQGRNRVAVAQTGNGRQVA